jgi:hypothetical protein
VYSIWRRTQRKRREEEAGAKKRKKIYEPGDVSQVLCSRLFSVDGWLEKERKKELLGQGGIQLKRKGEGEGAGFFL